MKSAPSHFTDEETSAQTFSIWLNSCAKVLRLANGGGVGEPEGKNPGLPTPLPILLHYTSTAKHLAQY